MFKDTKNALLVKDDVGRAKPSTRNLPPENFAYGKSAGHDPEGVAEVTRSWKFHDHSKDVVPEKDFKKLNALCIKKKAVKPKEMSKIKQEAEVRLKPPKGKKGVELTIPDADFSYGKPTKPPTPIKQVVHNFYGEEAELQTTKKYEEISKVPAEKLKKPKQTKASKKAAEVVKEKKKEKTEPKQLFKMKRFQEVAPKTDTHTRKKSPAKAEPKTEVAAPQPVAVAN